MDRRIEAVYPSREALERVLGSGKKLTIYWGVDPTGSDLHIEHAVNLFILRWFQERGHHVVVLLGDFTAEIGDPTGRDKKRVSLGEDTVKKNLKNYKKQIGKILDLKKITIRRNSEWWGRMNAKKLLELADLLTYQRLIERDMFQRRIREGKPISVREMLYPLLQGYDSVALGADVELGGTDQLFNMLIGRDFVRILQDKEKFVITKPILTDPRSGAMLMSKSSGRYIALGDSPKDMYGKAMALPDEVLAACYRLCLDTKEEEVTRFEEQIKKGESLRDLKMEFARMLAALYHGGAKAKQAEQEFVSVFQKKEMPRAMRFVSVKRGESIINVLRGALLVSSRAEARRLLRQGGVSLDGIALGEEAVIEKGGVLRVGKRRFIKLRVR